MVPGGCLRVRSLQLCLHRSWDRGDQSVRIPWSQDCLRDFRWWLDLPRLSLGVSLAQGSPDLDFWSDALDAGWGAHLGSLTFGIRIRQLSPSTLASSWQSGRASSIFSHLWLRSRYPFSATTALQYPISARRGAPGLRF